MSVLVDTSVWSLALRRRPTQLNDRERWRVENLRKLIEAGDARLIGSVRQEVLSGVRESKVFERLRDELRNFPDTPVFSQDYEKAAEMSNRCLSRGIAWTHVDLLICAVAKHRDWEVFTADRDFDRFSREFEFSLFENLRLH